MRFGWRQPIVYTHRWLGIAGGLLFVTWFASGIVMMYARMPELPAGDVLQRLAPLDVAQIHVAPPIDAPASGRSVDRIRVSMHHNRPVYRLASGPTTVTIFADTGEPMPAVGRDQAVSLVQAFVPEHARTVRYDALLADADQWTMAVRAMMPLHRVAVGDVDDTYFYVSQASGEIVMRTTAMERRWAYPGAVVHWLYFAPFRRQAAAWTQTIIWVSIAACVTCIAGLVWGVSLARRSPYSGLMKWHHYSGLIFGVTTFTWVFSGLLSMGPWGWSPGNAPTRAQRERVAGGALNLEPLTASAVRAAADVLNASLEREPLKELEVLQFAGALYLRAHSKVASIAHPERGAFDKFPDDAIENAARAALPELTVEEMTWLQDYDSYYYARDRRLSLPVLRVKYSDPNATWLYLDPRRGVIARKEERRSRIERWLYHGLHSLDFPFLYYQRPLWDVVVIALSIGGLVLSATTLLPGWRRVRRAISRSSPSPPRSSGDL
jgi:hypothetical protein